MRCELWVAAQEYPIQPVLACRKGGIKACAPRLGKQIWDGGESG
jgi:hypothetical protein